MSGQYSFGNHLIVLRIQNLFNFILRYCYGACHSIFITQVGAGLVSKILNWSYLIVIPYLYLMETPWHLYLMAVLYVVAGLIHFIKPKMYLRIMPRYLPNPGLLVKLSGLAEIVLGIALCIPFFRNLAIWLLITMLAIFLLVHFYMLSGKKEGAGIPQWVLILRIPLQFILMYWAYSYLST